MADLSTFLVIYSYPPDMAERRTPYRTDHINWLRGLAAAGRMILAGAVQDPVDTGVLVMRGESIQDIRRLLLDDPYAAGNLVVGVSVRPIGLVVGGD